MKPSIGRRHFLMAATASGVAGCSFPPLGPIGPMPTPGKASNAGNLRDYRRDAAGHLYSRNSNRIFKGMMPAMLYAIGVLELEIDSRGYVTSMKWRRAPSHAPEVIAEIERIVRQATPFPTPVRLGRVTYTDTWLWDKSGRFQLDTLTEGQE